MLLNKQMIIMLKMLLMNKIIILIINLDKNLN